MKRIKRWNPAAFFLVLIGALSFLTIFRSPAFSQDGSTDSPSSVTCEPYSDPNLRGAWPGDGRHFYWCGSAIGNTSAANQISETAAGFPANAAGKDIESAGESYYLFETRDESNLYWGSLSPQYSLTSSCGQTGYTYTLFVSIISAIYVKCHNYLTGQDLPSVSYPEVTAHESGHAFDFALASKQSNQNALPSESQGMRTVGLNDFDNLDSGRNTICHIFGYGKTPSGIESGWANPPLPAVCSNDGVENSKYTSLNNEQIANEVSVYFVYHAPLYKELFAQLFALQVRLTGFGVVPATDSMITTYSCSNFVMASYVETGIPPQSLNNWPSGCTPVSANQF